MNFSTFLQEDRQIGLSKKTYTTLSRDAQYAIETWESMNWHEGNLTQAVIKKDDVYQEIRAAFEPIRMILPSKVKLYRGYEDDGVYQGWKKARLQSWTSDKKVAEHFAGLRDARWRSLLYPVTPDSELRRYVQQLETRGFVSVGKYRYIINKNAPQYYNIYRGREFITDGDVKNFFDNLKDDEKWKEEANEKRIKNAVVLEKMISKEKILWITNNLNSKEYIIEL